MRRIEQLNSTIGQLIPEILARELSLKSGVFVTVTKVDTTPDLRYTRIFFSSYPEQEANYVRETLVKERANIQKKLAGQLKTRLTPQVEFILDQSIARADDIDHILKQIKDED